MISSERGQAWDIPPKRTSLRLAAARSGPAVPYRYNCWAYHTGKPWSDEDMGYNIPADHHSGGPQRDEIAATDPRWTEDATSDNRIDREAARLYAEFIAAYGGERAGWSHADEPFKKGFKAVAHEVLLTRRAIPNDLSMTRLIREAGETAASKGFHQGRLHDDAEVPRLLCLIHSEISEAMEAHRNDEGLERIAEELADVMIRVADLAYWLNLPLARAIDEKLEKNRNRDWKHGGKRY